MQDKLEKEPNDAKNAVEENVYEKSVNEDDRNSFILKLENTENWLYEDGEDQPKQVYVDKLTDLEREPPLQAFQQRLAVVNSCRHGGQWLVERAERIAQKDVSLAAEADKELNGLNITWEDTERLISESQEQCQTHACLENCVPTPGLRQRGGICNRKSAKSGNVVTGRRYIST